MPNRLHRNYYQDISMFRLTQSWFRERQELCLASQRGAAAIVASRRLFQFRPLPRRDNIQDRAKGRRRAAATGIHSILIVVHWDCQIRN